MRNYFILFIFIICQFTILAQSSWEPLEVLYNEGGIKVEVQFRQSNTCNTQKRNKYKFKLNGAYKSFNQYVNFKIEFVDCNGYTVLKNANVQIGKNGAGETLSDRFDESMDYVFEAESITRKFYDVKTSSSAIEGEDRSKKLTPEQKDKNAWKKIEAKPTIQAINEYKLNFPNGLFINNIPQVLTQIEDNFWSSLESNPSLNDIADYKSLYPSGKYLNKIPEILIKIEQLIWAQLEQEPTIEKAKKYESLYPSGIHISELPTIYERIEREVWKQIERNPTITGLNNYKAQYPRGLFINKIQGYIEKIDEDSYWQQVVSKPTVVNLTNYKSRYPTGAYISKVPAMLTTAIEKEAWETLILTPTIEKIISFQSTYPNGNYVSKSNDLLEDAYFKRASAADSYLNSCELPPNETALNYWKEYLTKYPSSKNSSTASTRIFVYEISISRADQQTRLNLYKDFETKTPNSSCISTYRDKNQKLSSLLYMKKRTRSAYVVNLFLPGIGHVTTNNLLSELGHEPLVKRRFPVFTSFVVVGGFASAGYYYNKALQYKNDYEGNQFPSEWDTQFSSANKNIAMATTLITTSCVVWALDYLNLAIKKSIIRKKLKKVI